jgi:L-2,4-diaminobutyrate decarboxylase
MTVLDDPPGSEAETYRADLLAGVGEGPRAVAALAADGLARYQRAAVARGGPIPAGGPAEVAARVRAALPTVLPADGIGAAEAIAELADLLGAGTADPAHRACAAHLHCPPLAVAAAADLLASVANASLDSWDQAPSASVLEDEVIATLAGLVGFPVPSAGVLTGGGTESNLMGLLLARDAALRDRFDVDPALDGVPPEAAGRLRIVCSTLTHFSVARAAALLGLGERAIVPIEVDAAARMDVAAAAAALRAMRERGDVPIAVVATAGTTDHGAIDPLGPLAGIAAPHGAWLHVDASYGGFALMSPAYAGLLAGIERANSVALDLHKLGWQPIAAGAFLTRDPASMGTLARRVAYLNPRDDEDAGYPNLLGRSLRTTRRADVVKIVATMRALGRTGLATLVERCGDLTRHAARAIEARPELDLLTEPVLTTVLFRYRGGDHVNAALRRGLLADGSAVIGRTDVAGAVALKLTLLNPSMTPADIDALLDLVVAAGRVEEREVT